MEWILGEKIKPNVKEKISNRAGQQWNSIDPNSGFPSPVIQQEPDPGLDLELNLCQEFRWVDLRMCV